MGTDTLFTTLGICVVAAPALLLALLGLSMLIGQPLSERVIGRSTEAAVVIGLLAALVILGIMLSSDGRPVTVELGNWAVIPHTHIPETEFHFHVKLVFDRLSVPFAILSFVLVGTIGAFANVYLHREPGYRRFFLFYAFFLLGMVVSTVAGTIETLFAGWELVGLSSALLVAYFHDRAAPVRNGLRVWMVYRVADAAFLIAALTLHNLTGEGDFERLMGTGPWPGGTATLTAGQALFVGLLLLVAAAGKSALVPFSGWLPRAMEGPTPSSAVFYGALSVHLGAYLLLRVSPILALSVWLSIAVICLGLVSALFGAVAARVQTDIKSALAFASLTQVGIIVAEIGLGGLCNSPVFQTLTLVGITVGAIGRGIYYIALIHIIGHACLRTLQLLRAPTLLRDYHALENAIGAHLSNEPSFWERRIPPRVRIWIYRLALERGYLDSALTNYLVEPFIRAFRWCDSMERRWTDLLSGGQSRESDRVEPSAEALEELP